VHTREVLHDYAAEEKWYGVSGGHIIGTLRVEQTRKPQAFLTIPWKTPSTGCGQIDIEKR
jgi:hypothetical protein